MREKVALGLMGALSKVIPAKRVIGISKYLYLRSLLDRLHIDLVLDVGANVGQFGRALRSIGYKGQIISFEPVAAAYGGLIKAKSGDDKWTAVNSALGEESRTRSMNVMKATVFSSFSAPADRPDVRFGGNVVERLEEVTVRTLGDFIDESGLEARLSTCLLKCDTQGHDLSVLRGAGRHLSKIRALQLEINVSRIYEDSPSAADIMKYLEDQDFAPVSFFPLTTMPDMSVVEFDYLGVNRAYGRSEAPAKPSW